MSIVPINNNDLQVGSFDPFSPELWDPFIDFPFPSTLSRIFPEFSFGAAVNSRLDWRETSNIHVFKAALPGFTNEDVLVELQDDRMLQISTESGSFMTKFKIPDNAKLDQLKAFMNNGVLTVTIPKDEATRPSVRAIEISGDD